VAVHDSPSWVVNHYDTFFKLNLTAQEKNDLIQYMKGL